MKYHLQIENTVIIPPLTKWRERFSVAFGVMTGRKIDCKAQSLEIQIGDDPTLWSPDECSLEQLTDAITAKVELNHAE